MAAHVGGTAELIEWATMTWPCSEHRVWPCLSSSKQGQHNSCRNRHLCSGYTDMHFLRAELSTLVQQAHRHTRTDSLLNLQPTDSTLDRHFLSANMKGSGTFFTFLRLKKIIKHELLRSLICRLRSQYSLSPDGRFVSSVFH